MRVRLPRQCPQVRTNSSVQNSIDTLSVDGARKAAARRSGVSKLRDDNRAEHPLVRLNISCLISRKFGMWVHYGHRN